MAIGDNNNSNLFGTNYNSEEEERKKAELAAQNARMGAGNVPASAFGQAPAVAPFSLEAAGQVNPMMEQQSLPAESVSHLMTDNPFIATGGTPTTAQPNVNFNAFSAADQANPAFENMSAGEIINKFNEPGYTTPPLVEPTFSERPKSRFRGFVDPIIDEFTSAGQDAVSAAKVGYQYFSDPSKPTLQSLTEQEKQNRSAGLADLQARNEESIRRGEAFLSQDATTQAPSGALTLGATPSVTPPVETPSVGAQGQVGAVQSPFLQSPDTPSGLGGPLLRGFNMVNDASRPPNAPMGQDATQAALGGRTLNEYLNAPAGTEGVSGLRTDPQGRMIPAGFETRAEAFPDFERESAAREARLDARPDFGEAASDRDRRAARGEGISMADRTAMAKANARDASPSEVARGNQVANELGVELKTGQPLQATGGLTFEQQLALRKEQRAEREEVRSVAEQEMEWEQTQGEARQERVDEMNTEIGALTSIIGQAENISGVATEASRQVGAGTAGFFSPLKWIGGTTAADLAGNLETIKSDAFVANITEMRQNSPTGGAVGNVSDKDLEMLQSLQTSFRQNLKPTTLKNNLKKYKEIRDKVARDAKAGFIRKYGPKNFNTYFGNQQQGGTQVSPIPNDRDSNTQIDPGLQQYFN